MCSSDLACHRCGYGVGDQISSRGPEDVAKTASETGEDRHADGSDEDVDRLCERPVAHSEQEPGEDNGKYLQGKWNRKERNGNLGRHGRHRRHQRHTGYGGCLQHQPFYESDGRPRNRRSVLTSFYHRSAPVSGSKVASSV